MYYFLGIDCGGTKIRSVLTENDTIVSKFYANEASNIYTVGLTKIVAVLSDVIDQAIKTIDDDPRHLTVVVGLAGLSHISSPDEVKRALLEVHPLLDPRSLFVVSDACIALMGSVAGLYGVTISVGTGAIALGRNRHGYVARSNGWGYLLGDEGSGYWLGKQAIKAMLRSHDGRGPQTALSEKILGHFNLETVEDILNTIHIHTPPHTVADLAPLVFEVAQEGDGVAQNILSKAGEELALAAKAVIEKLGMTSEHFPLAMAGSIFEKDATRFIHVRFSELIHDFAQHAQLIRPHFLPEVGAVMLGMKKRHGHILEKFIDQLQQGGNDGS